MMGTTYALLGYDALRQPGARVDQAAGTLEAIRRVLPLPTDDELLVRANGGLQAAAGALLALGVLPRLSATVLAGTMVPTTAAGHAFWNLEDPGGRKMQRIQFLKNLAMIGGLLAVAATRKNQSA
jgi:uncharacterized membrane protein YphA (DoxX/SURF4 family)